MRRLLLMAGAGAAAAYPLIVYFGINSLPAPLLAGLLIALALGRLAMLRGANGGASSNRPSLEGLSTGSGLSIGSGLSNQRGHRPQLIGWGAPLQSILAALLILAALYALLRGDPAAYRFYPVAVNAALLFVFGASLYRGAPVIEQLARWREPAVFHGPRAANAMRYTRRVTQVWCGFFLANGALALATALWASLEWWAFYNGFLAYVLMGILFAAEWMARRRRKRDAGIG